MGISTRMKVHQCRENGAHAYSAATPVLRSVLIFSFPALPLLGRRAKAHSGGGELLGKTDGAVMDIDVPSGRVIGGRCFNEFKTSKSRFCCPAVGKNMFRFHRQKAIT